MDKNTSKRVHVPKKKQRTTDVTNVVNVTNNKFDDFINSIIKRHVIPNYDISVTIKLNLSNSDDDVTTIVCSNDSSIIFRLLSDKSKLEFEQMPLNCDECLHVLVLNITKEMPNTQHIENFSACAVGNLNYVMTLKYFIDECTAGKNEKITFKVIGPRLMFYYNGMVQLIFKLKNC